jgi:hypothetical protein
MNRRSFILRVGGALVAVPAVLSLTACGDDDGGGGGTPDANLGATSFQASTSDNSGHSHSITVQCSDLSGNSATYTSTSGGGHTHSVTLDSTQLAAIANGDTVMVDTTDGGHAHTWAIAKGNAC